MYKCAVISLNVHKLATVQTVSVFPVLKCLYSPADRETEIRYKHSETAGQCGHQYNPILSLAALQGTKELHALDL